MDEDSDAAASVALKKVVVDLSSGTRSLSLSLKTFKDEVTSELESLRNELGRAASGASALAVERDALARDKALLKASLSDTTRVEEQLRGQLKDRDAAQKKLMEQLSRAQQAAATSERRAAAALTSLQEARREATQLEQERDREEEKRRREALTDAMNARQNSGPASIELESQLAAKSAQLALVQEELEEQKLSHTARLAELQEAFQAKIRNLKRAGEAAEAAAATDGADGSNDGNGDEVKRLSDALAEAQKNAKREKDDAASLRSRLKESDAEVGRLKKEMASASKTEQEALDAAASSDRRSRNLEAELNATKDAKEAALRQLDGLRAEFDQQRQKDSSNGPDASVLAAVEAMEGQMLKLSSIVRAREEEIRALKMTVHEACRERGEFQRLLQESVQREREASKLSELAVHTAEKTMSGNGGGGVTPGGGEPRSAQKQHMMRSGGRRGRPRTLAPLGR